jgi:nucleotide-binding universal stress UspA family protein
MRHDAVRAWRHGSRILVPVDFSPHSEHALRYAAAFAVRLDALVEVFHVVEEPVAAGAWGSEIPAPEFPELRDRLMAEAERQLDQYRPIIEDSHVRTVTTVRMGQPGQTIAAYAQAGGIDLIVMGTHDRGVGHLLMGSGVTERIARYAPCPVLIVRARGTHEEIEPLFMGERAVFGSVLGHHGTSRE